ncbi:GNAT family N-acetyltransferase [Microbacterium sp.]|uniref:GNAT family N-acetyltransferase n=1 Tax=Microbacterium sp. TaxID=51671 RepID=UPI0028125152|nr:GNAT family N-acetyltransferase [Microbacterium sp.]
MSFAITSWDGTDDQLTQAAELYADVFAEPPYDEERATSLAGFPSRVKRYAAEKPEFRLLLASEGDRVVGLALGTGIGPGDWWWDRASEELAPAARQAWLDAECFCVAELAVAASHRRRGMAEDLMDAVLRDLPYATALLGCYQDASAAQRLYTGLGWTVVDPAVQFTEERAVQVMGRRLTD